MDFVSSFSHWLEFPKGKPVDVKHSMTVGEMVIAFDYEGVYMTHGGDTLHVYQNNEHGWFADFSGWTVNVDPEMSRPRQAEPLKMVGHVLRVAHGGVVAGTYDIAQETITVPAMLPAPSPDDAVGWLVMSQDATRLQFHDGYGWRVWMLITSAGVGVLIPGD